jgi:hypothetical protein
MKIFIAIVGLLSFTSIFAGTAIALLFVGTNFALKIFISSLLLFFFTFFLDKVIGD